MDLGLLQLGLWLIAGIVSFYFSLGSARVWTSISLGFFLILVGVVIPTAIPFLPGADLPRVQALGSIIGTLAIMVMTHGFMEYYVFSRTLELEGRRRYVFMGTALVILGSVIFVAINPEPSSRTLEVIRMIENANWVFLSIINIDMLRKIYLNVKDTPIARGFVAFMGVFVCLFLWKGAALYIQVYDLQALAGEYPFRYQFSSVVSHLGNILASVSVGGTFVYLLRLLR